MNRSIILAATLAVGGLTYVGCDRNETASGTGYDDTASASDTAGDKVDRGMKNAGDAVGDAVDSTVEAGKNVGDKIGDAAEEAGARIRGTVNDADKGTAAAPDAEGIRDILASATEAALTEDGLDDLTERFADADRNRIGEAIGGEFPEHAALVKQFRADWKAKYNEDFDITNEEAAFPDTMFTVRQGEITSGPTGAEIVAGDQPGDIDANLEKGRNIATVAVMASHGLPEASVPLIHELPDNWRIDVPDTLTAQKLASSVVAHLKAAHDMKDQWPADVNDAYAAVGHHVLLAILDQPVQAK